MLMPPYFGIEKICYFLPLAPSCCMFVCLGLVEASVNESGLSLPQEQDLGEDSELVDIANKIKALSMSDSEDDDHEEAGVPEHEQVPLHEDAASVTSVGRKSPKIPSQEEKNTPREITPLMPIRSADLAKKMPFQVFVAKYCYNPQQCSPNENPEAELILNAGDYVFVYGDMDEDGFFEGELIDGTRGLVPSNFVEKVADEDLEDFHAAMAVGQRSDVESQSYQDPTLEVNSSDESELIAADLPEDSVKSKSVMSDLDDITEMDEDSMMMMSLSSTVQVSEIDTKHKGVPAPKNLQLDRQLKNSIMISWTPPDNNGSHDIQAYHVYVNGEQMSTTKATERTKALLESINNNKAHKVSVCAVSSRGQSKPEECAMTIGKDATLSPTDVRVTNITNNSAIICWSPSNSAWYHAIIINGREVKVIKPGIFKCSLSGLFAEQEYHVVIRAQKSSTPLGSKVAALDSIATVDFKTTSGCLPDAPLEVQVETGPKEGTLLVTWLPVTIATGGTSNGARVLGYSIYINGKKVKDLNSPTGDHTLLEAINLKGVINPKQLTVRTKGPEMESLDSYPAPLTRPLLQEIVRSQLLADTPETQAQNNKPNMAKSTSSQERTSPVVTSIASPPTSVPNVKVFHQERSSPLTQRSVEEQSKASPVVKVVNRQDKPVAVTVTSTSVETTPDIGQATKEADNANQLKASNEHQLCLLGEVSETSHSELSDIAEEEEEDMLSSVASREHHQSGQPISKSKHPADPSKVNPSGQPPVNPNPVTSHPDHTQSPQNAASDSTKSPKTTITPKMVEGSPKLAETGFMPIDSPRGVAKPDGKAGPKVIVEPQPVPSQQPPVMMVPQIEITKDSSGSLTSGAENATDDDIDAASSTSGAPSSKPSPMSPIREFYVTDKNGPHRLRNTAQGSHGAKRDIIDDEDFNGYVPPSVGRNMNDHSDKNHRKDHKDRPYSADRQFGNDIHNRSADRNRPMSAKHERSERSRGNQDSRSSDKGSNMHRGEHEGPQRSRSRKKQDGHRSDGRHSDIKSPKYYSTGEDSYHELTDNDAILPKKIRDDIPDSELIDFEDDGGESLVDSISEIQEDDNRVRIFIALFDYDPDVMSPNMDATDEELPFREGQLIKVYGEKDPDGFYMGEAHGRRGFVPCNMVSEVQVDDPDITQQLLQDSNKPGSRRTTPARDYSKENGSVPSGYPSRKSSTASPSNLHQYVPPSQMKRMIALYDYDPVELSPNVDAELELAFKTGDIVMIFGEMDEDGFFMGELHSQRGLVPSNFLQEVPPDAHFEVKTISSPANLKTGHKSVSSSNSSLADKTDQVRRVERPKAAHKSRRA